MEHKDRFEHLAKRAWCAPSRCVPGQSLEVSEQVRTRLDAALSQMHADSLMQSVRSICAFGERLSNRAEEAALCWLKAAYEQAGLVTKLERYPARVSVPLASTLTVDGLDIACITHPMTGSVERLTLPLELTSLEEIDVMQRTPDRRFDGKAVLIEGLATDGMLERLSALGAGAVIFAGGTYAHNMICTSQWGSPTWSHCNRVHTIAAVSVCAQDAQRIRARASQATRVTISTTVKTAWVWVPVLEATLEVPGSKDYVLVTGHIDSWGEGALDNASGNATALEVARILARHREQLTHSVKCVAWSGHSHGRYAGSTVYCDAHFASLASNCLLHHNADCLGGAGASLLTLSPAMACTAPLAKWALQYVTGCSTWQGVRFSRSCDQSFWGAGVPSVFSQVSEQPPRDDPAARAFGKLFGSSQSGGYGPYWHTCEDCPEHLDPDNLLRDARVILATCLVAAMSKGAALDAIAEAKDLQASLAYRRAQLTENPRIAQSALAQQWARCITDGLERLIVELDGWVDAHSQKAVAMAQLKALVCANYHEGDFGEHADVAPLKGAPALSVLDCLPELADEESLLRVLTQAQRALNSLRMRLMPLGATAGG